MPKLTAKNYTLKSKRLLIKNLFGNKNNHVQSSKLETREVMKSIGDKMADNMEFVI